MGLIYCAKKSKNVQPHSIIHNILKIWYVRKCMLDINSFINHTKTSGCYIYFYYLVLYIQQWQQILRYIKHFEICHLKKKSCHLQHNIIGHTFSSPSHTLLFLPFLFYTSHNGLHWKEEGVETTQTCVYYGRIT